jgi:decaprenylphospho-beta-D-ribofuranose 2-oxidase
MRRPARRAHRSLRATAPLRVLDGFGGAVRTASRYVEPASVDELIDLLRRALDERLRVTFRGAGRSYGDAALNRDGLVVDLQRLTRVLSWNRDTGEIEAEPGLTIEGLWRRTLADGYWPQVVPGTMRPTLGGCLSMNIHGKNNYRAGTFGDHVIEFDLVTPSGQHLTCSPTINDDVFNAAIGGLGLLGAITRVKMGLKRVESGFLRVEPLVGGSLDEILAQFTESLPASDYTVGWIDGLAEGRALGRGVIHRAKYVPARDMAEANASLSPDRQDLPSSVAGIPHRHLWRFMRPMMFNGGVRAINAAKFASSRWQTGRSYLQSHVAFAFLLDYIPDWRLAYGPSGFIQYQLFVPRETARDALSAVLTRCQARGLPAYLGVLKRHRPDRFLLSHAVDGWSLALDFRIGDQREALLRLTDELTAIVLEAGGRFYFAKDSVLRPEDVLRAYGRERLERFLAIKTRLDPDDLLTSDLWRRVIDRSQH